MNIKWLEGGRGGGGREEFHNILHYDKENSLFYSHTGNNTNLFKKIEITLNYI